MAATQPNEERTTDRDSIVIPLQVYGSDVEGKGFIASAHTLVVNAHGALIWIDRTLAPMEEVVLRRDDTHREAEARVLGRVRKETGPLMYAVKLIDPSINLWGIHFLPLSESARAVVRTLLGCAKCARREVVYLDEFEAEVFEANDYIFHPCPACRETTIWRQSEYEFSERPASPPQTSSYHVPPLVFPEPPRSVRRHVRVSCRLKACIRYGHNWEEVLELKNVSRGGVGFESQKHLPVGAQIEVAVPYSKGAGNIFVLAEIVRFRQIPEKNITEYGASYEKPFERHA